MCGRGAFRDPHDRERVEKVQVRYHIGVLHEYADSVMLHMHYPDALQDEGEVDGAWPCRPPYNPPLTTLMSRLEGTSQLWMFWHSGGKHAST